MLEPLLLIHGDDPFLVTTEAQGMRDGLCADLVSELGLEEFKESFDLDAIHQSLATPPFLAIRRVVLLWDPPHFKPARRAAQPKESGKRENDASRLLSVLKLRAETTAVVVVLRAALPSTSVVLKGIRALGGEIRLVSRPRGRELRRQVEERAAARGLTLPALALQLLTEVATADMGCLEMELDKLDLYSRDGSRITGEVANLLITSAPTTELYRLTDALFSRPGSVGAKLEQLMGRPEIQTPLIMGALARVLRDLVSFSDPAEKESWRSATSWRLERLGAQLSRAGATRLRRWLIELSELDWRVRAGLVDDRQGLETLIASMATELQAQPGARGLG
ncbi:MAG TPA: DNA polymerase III subunit delta [Candidatus Dormibacteraeota bacterium]|nr:DNA polymerase III subunit delta [Candidatus Dormibacteraeota bacterium]